MITLTREEAQQVLEAAEVERWVEFKEDGSGRIPTGKLIRYIEAKLKEKNHDLPRLRTIQRERQELAAQSV